MNSTRHPYRILVINLLTAAALSLITNFSYVIYTLGNTPPGNKPSTPTGIDDITIALNFTIQILFYFIYAFVLFSVVTHRVSENASRRKNLIFIYVLLISIGFYFLAPVINGRGELIQISILTNPVLYPTVLLKCIFTLVVSILYGMLFDLLYQKQRVVIENEMLKNENLQTRYNMLVNQINPHFFFNSLNSLSMLVREKDLDRAQTYINQMSDTFRYILQNGQTEMTSLRQELQFLDAYRYLQEIRYEGKLFFDIQIDDQLRGWLLPALSLQPLVENAVKHNSITRSRPLVISVSTQQHSLVVSNPIIPKLDPNPGTGIGLKNLRSRYQFLTGQDITVVRTQDLFSVSLPLIVPGS